MQQAYKTGKINKNAPAPHTEIAVPGRAVSQPPAGGGCSTGGRWCLRRAGEGGSRPANSTALPQPFPQATGLWKRLTRSPQAQTTPEHPKEPVPWAYGDLLEKLCRSPSWSPGELIPQMTTQKGGEGKLPPAYRERENRDYLESGSEQRSCDTSGGPCQV